MAGTMLGGHEDEVFRGPFITQNPTTPLQAVRIFVQTDAWGSGEWRDVAPAIAAGRVPIVSAKLSGTWSQAAGGSQNARFDAIVAGLEDLDVSDLPQRPQLTIHHEPEGDDTPANYNRLLKWFVNRYRARLEAAGWDVCVILMGGTFSASTQWTLADVDVALAGTGITNVFADVYEKRGVRSGVAWATKAWRDPRTDPESWVRRYLEFALSKGWTPALPEFACSRTQADTAGAEQAAFLEACNAWDQWPKFLFAIWYNRVAGEGGAQLSDWTIHDKPAPLRAFGKLFRATTGGGNGDPGDPDCAELEELLEAARALLEARATEIEELEAEKASLQANLVTATTRIGDLEEELAGAQAALAASREQRDEALEKLAQIHVLSG